MGGILKLLQIDQFFDSVEVQKLRQVLYGLQFVQKEYGKEIDNFQLILPDINEILSQVLHHSVAIEEARSGVFRRPETHIHFESFTKVNDWVFVVALEDTTFNTFRHLSGAESALDDYKFNYRNLLEWDVETNNQLRQNSCIFFRPWLFHSFDGGLIQTYRLSSIGKSFNT